MTTRATITLSDKRRLVDAWLAEYEAEQGAFDEDELEALAEDAGVPYLPPESSRSET